MNAEDILRINPFDPETGDIRVIVETPKGSRNKYKLDVKTGLFKLDKVLPAGAEFPHDFGFFPSTVGEDGDPLDALVLSDAPLFPGAVVLVRVIGAIKAEQTDAKETIRNDRLLAVPTESLDYAGINDIADLSATVVRQIEHFFIGYNRFEQREFKPIGKVGGAEAKRILDRHVVRQEPDKEAKTKGAGNGTRR